MLEGTFHGDASPAITGIVWIENHARWIRVEFLLDPSCSMTIVAATDIDRAPLPLDDVVEMRMDDRPPVTVVPVPALVSFVDEAQRYTYQVNVLLSDHHVRSRLGWDVLSRWLTVIDPEGSAALFEPQSWDGRGLAG